MHESGIIKSALDIVAQAAAESGIHRITEIKLVIGQKRVVLPDALFFGFAAFTKDSPLFKDCQLTIETRDILLLCQDCQHQFNAELSVSACPNCHSRRTSLLEGNELYIDYFESGGDQG